jgi:TonB family protein
MAVAYPRRAKNHDVSGRAVLDCAVEAERLADCKIAQETPLGWDFGAAALNLSSIFHLRPIMVDGEIDLNARVQIPMAFTIP